MISFILPEAHLISQFLYIVTKTDHFFSKRDKSSMFKSHELGVLKFFK
ncbi:hypothetical protein HOF65_07295 [bacterium]|nr:hypothetical protein [bacterium]MBT4633455.1 hypothetical protein [bacterium]